MEGNNHMEGVLHHSRAIGLESGALIRDLRATAHDLSRTFSLRKRMAEHPWSTLAGAAIAGYVLGGGLFTPLTGRIVHWGTRGVLIPLLRAQLGLLQEPAETNE